MKFKDQYVEVLNLQYPNADAAANLKDFMDKSNETAAMYANDCYEPGYFVSEAKRKKIAEKNKEIARWGLKSVLKTFSSAVLPQFNKEKSPDFESKTMWEAFKVGNIQGYRALNLYNSAMCYTNVHTTGRAAIYVFAHPSDPSSLLVFVCHDRQLEQENYLATASALIEKLVSRLKF